MSHAAWPLAAAGGWIALALVAAGAYGWRAWRGSWARWRVAVFGAGVAMTVVAARGLDDPLASMTDYTAALMVLGQVVSPLLLLGFPAEARAGWHRGRHRIWANWLLDPWVAFAVFVLLTVGINLPGVFETALADALFSAPIGLLVLVGGLLVWAQLLDGSRAIGRRWVAGIWGWFAGLPMMVIAAVWVWSGHVLYTPYLDVLCLWNLSPLDDQHYAGLVMFAAGLPLQLRAAWLLIMSDEGGAASTV
jgi:putative membrane protein